MQQQGRLALPCRRLRPSSGVLRWRDLRLPAHGQGRFPLFSPPVQPATCDRPLTVKARAASAPVAEGSEEPKKEADFGRRDGESRGDYMRREFSALKPFAIISVSYLLFTAVSGAVSGWPCESLF